jgi:hypothetical protein
VTMTRPAVVSSSSLRPTHLPLCRLLWLLPIIVLTATTSADAQLWSGILSRPRATDWSTPGPGVASGIPGRTVICQSLSPGATVQQINTALTNCPSGQVVLLTAGTYNLSSGITFGQGKSNVTLRGAGPDRTKLVFTGDVSCQGLFGVVCMAHGNWIDKSSPQNSTNWTGGYSVGSSVITVASAANITVGELIALDQRDDTTDTGAIYVCTGRGICSEEGGNAFGRSGRGQQQWVKVTAVSGNQLSITPPIRMPNWRSSQSPGAMWNANVRVIGNGVEDLTVDVTGTKSVGIVAIHSSDCWIKNVRVVNPGRNHVWLNQDMRITIRDSYFFGGQGGASQSYGIETFATGDLLIENNIFQHVTQPIQVNGSDTGSVYAYNFSIDDNYTASSGFMIKTIAIHEVGVSHGLFEGNDGLGFTADDIHGTTHFGTLFRNYFYGDIWNNPPKVDSTDLVALAAFARFFNIIGNVLGRSPYYDTYETDLNGSDTAIFTFGWSRTGLGPDPMVKTTSMRWGNYNTVTTNSRFLASEVPSALTQYANLVPLNQSLPPSFYLRAKPAWFGSTPWPTIGPDVTGGQHASGHAFKIPARACWEQMPPDTAYGTTGVRLFRPATCYGADLMPPAPPAAPDGLVVGG